jgi:hypothetical protein
VDYRRIAVALGAVLLVVLPATPGHTAPPTTGRSTFGIQPATAAGPDTRASLSYGVTKGAQVRDYVAVSNYSDAPVTVAVYAADAFNTAQGGFDLLGAWVTVDQSSVVIPAKGKTVVPFTIRIPANATPGDHAGGIVASLTGVTTAANGDKVAVDERVGTRIYARVAGNLRATLTVDSVDAHFHPGVNPFASGWAELTYTVRNTGNVRLSARQRTTATTLWGQKLTSDPTPDVAELLPGNAVTYTVRIPNAFPALWLTGQIQVAPRKVGGDLDPPVFALDRSVGFWALGWALLILLVPVALLVFVGWRLVRLVRRRSTPRRRRAIA